MITSLMIVYSAVYSGNVKAPCRWPFWMNSSWIHFIFTHLIKQLQRVHLMLSLLEIPKFDWLFAIFLLRVFDPIYDLDLWPTHDDLDLWLTKWGILDYFLVNQILLVQITACHVAASNHYLNWCLHIVNWTLTSKWQLNFNQNATIFILEGEFEKAVCKMVATLWHLSVFKYVDFLQCQGPFHWHISY